MEDRIQPSLDDGFNSNAKSDADLAEQPFVVMPDPVFKFSPANPVYAMAYGGGRSTTNATDIEVRLQKLEKGQKVLRRGRVVVSVPKFKTQIIVSQTDANNPFADHNIGGVSFAPGQVPDSIAPSLNSSIKFPSVPSQP